MINLTFFVISHAGCTVLCVDSRLATPVPSFAIAALVDSIMDPVETHRYALAALSKAIDTLTSAFALCTTPSEASCDQVVHTVNQGSTMNHKLKPKQKTGRSGGKKML